MLRINRYIVGCKSDRLDDLFGKRKRINRYIVGCKLWLELESKQWLMLELIDT